MNLQDFSSKIRENNKNLHKAAESTGFNKRLIDGNASKETYAEFLFNYMAVYKAIENALENSKDLPDIKPFITPELYRSEALKKDVEYILKDKVAKLELLASTKACVSRIEEISKENPILIVAHAYTRFLADLFGGRTIYQVVKENYIQEDEGLNYYKFPEITDIKDYVFSYRIKLSSINLNAKTENAFLNEIANSYLYNIGISTELESKLF